MKSAAGKEECVEKNGILFQWFCYKSTGQISPYVTLPLDFHNEKILLQVRSEYFNYEKDLLADTRITSSHSTFKVQDQSSRRVMDNQPMASIRSFHDLPNLTTSSSIAIASYEPDFSKAIASIIWSRHRTQTTSVIFKCNIANCPLCPTDAVPSSQTHTQATKKRRRMCVRAKRSVERRDSKSKTASITDCTLDPTSSSNPYVRPSASQMNFSVKSILGGHVHRPDWPRMTSFSSPSTGSCRSSSCSLSEVRSTRVIDIKEKTDSSNLVSSCLPSKRRRVSVM
ncbi:uncharacterized protein LOC121424706 [Lytechinus variegatus]|uniref:uncharacterized protein LOC121424706 n=1 Tax=Lytechinus variegatus TaxID=7654 RepID=UPI001BB2726A|nr:uncharacterized protein LOC121424706 [Lytechinus variegatus]